MFWPAVAVEIAEQILPEIENILKADMSLVDGTPDIEQGRFCRKGAVSPTSSWQKPCSLRATTLLIQDASSDGIGHTSLDACDKNCDSTPSGYY